MLGFVTAVGTLFVWYFSKDLKALDTIDFWVGTLLIFIQATILIVMFGWSVGIEKGWKEMHLGADMRVPNFFKTVIRYITPGFLITIFLLFVLKNVCGWNFAWGAAAQFEPTGYVRDLIGPEPDRVARISVALIVVMFVFTFILIQIAGRRWESKPLTEQER